MSSGPGSGFRRLKRRDILLFSAIAVFLFLRAPYGYCFSDEPFLVSLAKRLYEGDMLIVDEWHGTQNTGLLLLPFYAVYYGIHGSTEGILLAFRYCYCVMWLLCLLYMRIKLDELGWKLIPALIYLALFSPLDYMTLSYTSISLAAVLVSACIVYADVIPKRKRAFPTGLRLGVLLTVITLCYPFTAIPVLLFYFAAALMIIRNGREKSAYLLQLCAGMLIPIALGALAYCMFVLSAGFERVAANLPELFKDPAHSTGPISMLLISLRTALLPNAAYLGFFLIISVSAAVGKHKPVKYRAVLFALAVLLFGAVNFSFFRSPYVLLNYQMKDVVLVGLIAYLLTENRNRRLLLSFGSVSAVYVLSCCTLSNTKAMAYAQAASVLGFAAVIFIVELGTELYSQYRGKGIVRYLAAGVAAAMLVMQLGGELRVRLMRTYHDRPLWEMTTIVARGPAKGLKVSSDKAEMVSVLCDSYDRVFAKVNDPGHSLMTTAPWIYLYSDMRNAAYSSWSLENGEMYATELRYCELNGKDLPEYIFVDNVSLVEGQSFPGYAEELTDDYLLLIRK